MIMNFIYQNELRDSQIQVCRTDKNPLGTKGRTSILSYREYVRPAELHSQSAEENCPTENVSSLRSVKGATLPCAAYAAIPCGLAVCKQHKMLFAASKFDINKFGGIYDKKNDDGIMYIRLYLYFSCVFWIANKRTTYFRCQCDKNRN